MSTTFRMTYLKIDTPFCVVSCLRSGSCDEESCAIIAMLLLLLILLVLLVVPRPESSVKVVHAWTSSPINVIPTLTITQTTTATSTSRTRNRWGRDHAAALSVFHHHQHASLSFHARSFASTQMSTTSIRSSSELDTDTATTVSIVNANNEDTNTPPPTPVEFDLTDEQRTFVIGYINKHHTSTFNIPIVTTFSPIGIEMAQANVWSGGSYTIVDAKLIHVSLLTTTAATTTTTTNGILEFNVTIQRRSQPHPEYRQLQIPLDARPNKNTRRNSNDDQMTTTTSSAWIGTEGDVLRLIPTTPIDEFVQIGRASCRERV